MAALSAAGNSAWRAPSTAKRRPPFDFLQQAERHFQAIFTGDKRPEEAVLVIAFGDEAGLKPGLIARISAATGLALIRSEHGFAQRAAGA